VADQGTVITGVGLVTPVGLGAAESCAAMRAGISRLALLDNHYDPIRLEPEWDPPNPATGAFVAPLGLEGLSHHQRLLRMMRRALGELLQDANMEQASRDRIGLLMAASAEERNEDLGLFPELTVEELLLEVEPGFGQVQVLPAGSSGVLSAMQQAAGLLARGELDACVIGGADSLLDLDTMRWLDEGGRLQSARIPEGLQPGEAAGFLLLERADIAAARGAHPLAVVEGIGVAREEAPPDGSGPPPVDGLAKAVSDALIPCPEAPTWALGDLNGEAWRFQEWGLVQARLQPQLENLRDSRTHATSIGHVGAASGVVSATMVVEAFRRGRAPGPRALAFSSSYAGLRGAMVLARPDSPEMDS